MTKSRNINKPKHKWTPIEDVILLACYPFTTAGGLAKAIGCTKLAVYQRAYKLGLEKSQWFKESILASRLRRDDNPGIAYRYPKGHVPANKGIKGVVYPGTVATQFKPGTRPKNWRPVGSTRICSKDGYILMKMAEGNFKWFAIHRIIYERMHGPVPEGYVTYFVDGNKLNISITNISTITLVENARRNSIHNLPKDIVDLLYLKTSLTRQIKKREREASHE